MQYMWKQERHVDEVWSLPCQFTVPLLKSNVVALSVHKNTQAEKVKSTAPVAESSWFQWSKDLIPDHSLLAGRNSPEQETSLFLGLFSSPVLSSFP